MLAVLVEAARPDEAPVVDGHVRAPVAHVHLAVGHHVDRLDDDDRLEVDARRHAGAQEVARIFGRRLARAAQEDLYGQTRALFERFARGENAG